MNIVAASTIVYTYDNRNEQTSAIHKTSPTGTVTETDVELYDVWGQWIGEQVYAGTTDTGALTSQRYFTYDPADGRLIAWIGTDLEDADYSEPVSIHRYLTAPGIDQVLADDDTDYDASFVHGTHWLLADNLGTVRDITDAAGAEEDHIVYDSFGNVQSQTDADYQSLIGFTGQPFDANTGMQNNGHREYFATLGRWAQSDPLGLGPDTNPERYVDNAPTDGTDPRGLCTPHPVNIGIAPALPGPSSRQTDTTEDTYRIAFRKNKEIDTVYDVTSPQDMVNKIIAGLSSCDCISTLYIGGHGFSGTGAPDIGSIHGASQVRIEAPDVPSTFGPLSKHVCHHCQVLFFGCDVATGPAGINFIHAVADATGCDVTGYSGEITPDERNGMPNPVDGATPITVHPNPPWWWY